MFLEENKENFSMTLEYVQLTKKKRKLKRKMATILTSEKIFNKISHQNDQ